MELQDCRAFQTESVGKCGPRYHEGAYSIVSTRLFHFLR